MNALLAWVTGVPPGALCLILFGMAALENVFPPLPSDTVVAFGSFLAARGHAGLLTVALWTWSGNVVGAVGMYALGRRYGADRMRAVMARKGTAGAGGVFGVLYGRYGLPALVVSRFLPGVRAVVPPLAGALRVPAPKAIAAIALASAVWYGLINVFAYRVGEHWDVLLAQLGTVQRASAAVAIAGAVIMLVAWWVNTRIRRLERVARLRSADAPPVASGGPPA